MELRAANIIDSEIEGHYGFFPIVDQISTRRHHHDFFEIFLIAKGTIHHHVNGETTLLSEGHLVFIRPEDAHCFSQHEHQNCELLNIAFLQSTQRDVCAFLDHDTCTHVLLQPQLPPTVTVSQQALKSVIRQLEQWGRVLHRDKQRSRLALRGLLANVVSAHFLTPSHIVDDAIPRWLQTLCHQMEDRENIIEGRDALLRLANRTPEYVGRSFKQHLGITPSRFINDLRLDYAADLLLHTDQTLTEICYATGFGNLSHFYHLFKKRWRCAPNQYRKR
ncbi:MAG: helix-turn-helix transcriptional regulator, partial [Chloroflexota bacterium]